MSNLTVEVRDKITANERPAESSSRVRPTWWIVCVRELSELWIWGRALHLIILYSVYLGVSSYVFAADSELSLLPPREMVYLTVFGAISVSLFIALIIGADSFSGERERSTLEALLLTPANRTQIVVGKFLASISPWPVAMVIAIPYAVVLSQGDEILPTALLWGGILGSLLSPAFTGLAMIVSLWSSSNRTSLFGSLTIFLLMYLPVQFPGTAQSGVFGKLLEKLDPLEGADYMLERIIVNNHNPQQLLPFLWSSIAFALLVFVVLFFFAAPSLRLNSGIPIKWRRKKNAVIVSILLATCLLLLSGIVPAQALQPQTFDPQNLRISVDISSAEAKTGDQVEFHTTVTNNGKEASPQLVVAMNIINLDAEGDVVDPEDWSPERTQYLESVAPGSSAIQSWMLNTLLEGDYLVYVVLMPASVNEAAISQPLTSQGIHVKVYPFTRLNPRGILPLALGIPVVLMLILLAIVQIRRRSIDVGASASTV